MEWAYFKEGTYWIYEEETTGARDTFTVLTSNDYISNPSTEPYEFFGYTTHRSSDDYTYWFWFNEGWTFTSGGQKGNCCSCRKIWCDKYTSGNADGEDVLLAFPTFIGSYSGISFGGGEYGKVEVINYFEEMQVGENIFTNVVVENNENSVLDQQYASSDYNQVKYYFSRAVGIIRKEIEENSEIWNLVEYNIVQ